MSCDLCQSAFQLAAECLRVLEPVERPRVLALLLVEFEVADPGTVKQVCELLQVAAKLSESATRSA